MSKTFYQRVIDIIKSIPKGKVPTHGQIAAYAGNSHASRQFAYILHSSSRKQNLPWHRVVNSKGSISLKPGYGYELQKEMLKDEEIIFNKLESNKWIMDYHIHTTLSDGKGNHDAYIRMAQKRKIDEIGFSDHLCLKKVSWAMELSQISSMIETINHLKKNSKVVIKLGVEMDYFPGFENKIKEIIAGIPFDYVIGSVHFINDWTVDHPDNISEYEKWDVYELYKVYFNLVQQTANSKLFDIIGHPDLIKKFGFKPKRDISDLLEETAEIFKNSGICIEINTSGLTKPCKEIYPSKKLLKMCFDKGVPVTLGSDAHRPQDIGQHFDEAIKLIKEIGYIEIVQFTKRKRKFIRI